MKNTIDEVRAVLNTLHDKEGMNWREIGESLGLNKGTVYKVAVKNFDPKNPAIRVKLGLPATEEVPVCESCGVVHIRPCRKRRARKHHDSFRDLFSTPVEILRRDLENREEV